LFNYQSNFEAVLS